MNRNKFDLRKFRRKLYANKEKHQGDNMKNQERKQIDIKIDSMTKFE